MKQQKHKRKESFSILLVSNTGKDTRQFHISVTALRLIIVLMFVICATFAWTIYRSGTHYANESELRRKLVSSEQTIKQLENENETLSVRNASLTEENELFKRAETVKAEMAEMSETKESQEDETPEDTSVPSQYPCTAGGILKDQYSEEHPYFTIIAQQEDSIIAAGDGTVSSVGADDIYSLIIEIDHGNGYRTRYMCLQAADAQVETGQQVQISDALMVINGNDTQLDYMVIYGDQAIDPMLLMEAKG